MPKIVDKELMKKSIINAALQSFLKYGFNKTTMDQIANETNIAKGTLYLYFKSKDVLISSITELHFKKLLNDLLPKEYCQTLEQLLEYIKNALLINEEDSKFIPIFFEAFGSKLSSDVFMKDYKNLFDKIGYFYAQNFKILIQNNQVKPTLNTETFARVLVSMIDGIILHKGFFKIEERKYSIMVEDAIDVFRLGLSKV
ncbi:MAG: TetR/AcrR family transcriptional regulator [Campylobacteraceae bacterium]|nr:TetR/AcrR family transcriptional regulator [Campylobacteraceae bacterium]